MNSGGLKCHDTETRSYVQCRPLKHAIQNAIESEARGLGFEPHTYPMTPYSRPQEGIRPSKPLIHKRDKDARSNISVQAYNTYIKQETDCRFAGGLYLSLSVLLSGPMSMMFELPLYTPRSGGDQV